MKKIKNVSQGFTLLELLVVVLIIGILAAIALPQYKRAVEKSKSAQLKTLVSSVVKSAETYYLVNNTYPTSFEELDIGLNWPYTEDNICAVSISGDKAIKQDNGFQIILNMDSGWGFATVLGVFIEGAYKCTGFVYFFKGTGVPQNQLICTESTFARGTKNQKGDFCEKVMGETYYSQKYNWWHFK